MPIALAFLLPYGMYRIKYHILGINNTIMRLTHNWRRSQISLNNFLTIFIIFFRASFARKLKILA